MAAVRHIGLVWGILGPPVESTWLSIYAAKVGYDRCSSFDNMNVTMFGAFGWKTPIHATKIVGLGLVDPVNGVQYQRKPKRNTVP